MHKLAAFALAALFALSAPIAADARARGPGEGGGHSTPETPSTPGPSTPDPAPAGGGSAGDGSGADARGAYRLFCDRWPRDYWCQPGPPYVAVPK